jgi:hypothetical protein
MREDRRLYGPLALTLSNAAITASKSRHIPNPLKVQQTQASAITHRTMQGQV